MTVQEKLYTADEFWEISRSNMGKKWELVKGVVVEMSPTGDTHTILATWIAHLLLSHVASKDLGDITGEAGGYTLSTDPDTVRAPDVGFISKARLTPMTGKYYPVAPDLAVEIVSPNDTATEIHDKIIEYLQAGTRLIWVVYPRSRTIDVYTAAGARTLDVNGTLEGGEVLPGFSVPVHGVFERLRS